MMRGATRRRRLAESLTRAMTDQRPAPPNAPPMLEPKLPTLLPMDLVGEVKPPPAESMVRPKDSPAEFMVRPRESPARYRPVRGSRMKASTSSIDPPMKKNSPTAAATTPITTKSHTELSLLRIRSVRSLSRHKRCLTIARQREPTRRKCVRRPVSRVLSPGAEAPDRWPFILTDRRRPVRAVYPDGGAGTPLRPPFSRTPQPSLFDLAPGGACRAAPVAGGAVGSYPTVSPLPGEGLTPPGGLFSVALSLGFGVSPSPAGGYPAPRSSGARTFLTPFGAQPSGRLTGLR